MAIDVASISALKALNPTVNGEQYNVLSYHGNWQGTVRGPIGGGIFYYDANDTTSAENGVTIFIALNGKRIKRILSDHIDATQAGARGDGATDDSNAIDLALAYVRTIGGKLIFSKGNYHHSRSICYEASNVAIEGETPSTTLTYTGTGTGLLISASYSSPQRQRCALRRISLVSTTGAIAFDWSGGSYGNYQDFEINYTAPGAKFLYARGISGLGPYCNQFSGFTLFGSDYSQYGIWLDPHIGSGFSADGPNANVFSDLKRGATLNRLINIVSGVGNLFTNIGAESIKDALIVLNDSVSVSDYGTATAATTNTLTDSTKAWPIPPDGSMYWGGASVKLTSGPCAGEVRRVIASTATRLDFDKSWPKNIGTPTYQIFSAKAVHNKFVNVRQEGLNTLNPDGVRIMPGALHNEFSQLEIASLGSGSVLEDFSGDPSNKVRTGDLVVERFVVTNPGANASKEVVPRLSAFGGIRAGSNMSLEYIEATAPNFVSGAATITVDHGGSAPGNGAETLVVVLDNFNSKEAFRPSKQKIMRSTTNNGIYVHLATNASFAAAEVIVTIAYRVN